MKTPEQCRVVVIDDDDQFLELVQSGLGSSYTAINCFQQADEAAFLACEQADAVVLDLLMPDADGVDVLRRLAHAGVKARLILISGQDQSVLRTAQDLARAKGLHVEGTLSKPLKLADLRQLLRQAGLHEPAPTAVEPPRAWAPKLSDIEHALTAQQFLLYYQPKLRLVDKRLAGVEALIRWNHPEHGMVPPLRFIPMIEQGPLMQAVTEFVIDAATRQWQRWAAQGLRTDIAINASATNLSDIGFPARLFARLQERGTPCDGLTLEVTETALMTELVASVDVLIRLRLKGFHLSIDDFGTGYSSLAQLHKIPFTEMKIDRGFVNRMCVDVDSRAIVETCIMLGHKLNMKVVAEGVEDQSTDQALQQMGCDIAQGFYYARPLSAEALQCWVAERERA